VHISALGTFAAWAGFDRPRSDLITYLLRAKGKSTTPPPKVRVHLFNLRSIVSNLDRVLTDMSESAGRLDMLYVCTAMIMLTWPVRPHTLVSIPTDNVSSVDNGFLFQPCAHKRAPTDWVFRVQLPPKWYIVFK
jgi:hypothetical protein